MSQSGLTVFNNRSSSIDYLAQSINGQLLSSSSSLSASSSASVPSWLLKLPEAFTGLPPDYFLQTHFSDTFDLIGGAVDEYDCGYEFATHLGIRFPLIVFFAGSICCAGVFGNLATIYVLTRRRMQTTSNWFLVMLAFFDLGVLIGSFLIFIVEVVYDYMENFALYELWFSYIKGVFLMTHICQGSAVYATTAATIERWLQVFYAQRHQKVGCICRNRHVLLTAVAIFIVAVVIQVPKYFESEILIDDSCQTFGRYALVASKLLDNRIYVAVYAVWITNTLFVFIPFVVLLALNTSIFYKITRKRMERKTTLMTPWVKRIQARIYRRKTRQATIVLLIVVFVFLLCNIPSLSLTLVEHVAPWVLKDHPTLYSFSRDLVNILAVVNSSATFAVYLLFAKDYRNELLKVPRYLKRRFCETIRHRRKLAIYRRWRRQCPPNQRRKSTLVARNIEPVDLLLPCRDNRKNIYALVEQRDHHKSGESIFEALP